MREKYSRIERQTIYYSNFEQTAAANNLLKYIQQMHSRLVMRKKKRKKQTLSTTKFREL